MSADEIVLDAAELDELVPLEAAARFMTDEQLSSFVIVPAEAPVYEFKRDERGRLTERVLVAV